MSDVLNDPEDMELIEAIIESKNMSSENLNWTIAVEIAMEFSKRF